MKLLGCYWLNMTLYWQYFIAHIERQPWISRRVFLQVAWGVCNSTNIASFVWRVVKNRLPTKDNHDKSRVNLARVAIGGLSFYDWQMQPILCLKPYKDISYDRILIKVGQGLYSAIIVGWVGFKIVWRLNVVLR